MYIALYIKGYNIVERKVPYDICVYHSMLIKFCFVFFTRSLSVLQAPIHCSGNDFGYINRFDE